MSHKDKQAIRQESNIDTGISDNDTIFEKEEFIPPSQWGDENKVEKAVVEKNLLGIRQKIAHCNVKIIAVTKYFGTDAIKTAYELGIRDFAESRAVESIKKIESLPEEVKQNSTFHFIGHLQSNKVNKVVKTFNLIHSVDSIKIASEISKAACSINKREKVLLQVNNAGEEQKTGYTKEQLKKDLPEILKLEGIEVCGLMNMAPLNAEEKVLNELFEDIRLFRDNLEKDFGIKLEELSMGMSNDYEIAIKHGATIIRVGRKLFSKI